MVWAATEEPQKMIVNNLKYFSAFLLHTLKQKHGVLPGKGEGMEDKDKGLASCRKVWQGTLLLLKYDSFWTRLCRHRTMYLCIAFSFQAQAPWPGFSSQASDQGMDVMTRRECQKESEKCPAQSVVSVCAPLEAIPTQSSQARGGLRDYVLVHPLLALLIFPYLLHDPVETGDRDLAWCMLSLTFTGAPAYPSPCHKIFPSVRSP